MDASPEALQATTQSILTSMSPVRTRAVKSFPDQRNYGQVCDIKTSFADLFFSLSLLDALASSEDDDEDESSSEETKQSSSQKLLSNSQELSRECACHLCRLINIYTVS